MRIIDLERINKAQIQRAGPRYAPGLDPNAPNILIDSVLLPIGALTGDQNFVEYVRKLRYDLLESLNWRRPSISKYFKSVKSTPDALAEALKGLADATPSNRSSPSRLVNRISYRVRTRLRRLLDSLYEMDLTGLGTEERVRAENERSYVLTFMNSLDTIIEFTGSSTFSAITSNKILLLGDWGTGKTHLLCDVAKDRIARGLPTLLFLAKELPRDTEPLQGLCNETGLAASPRELLRRLHELGEQSGAISLLIIDGINEGDRSQWRTSVGHLAKSARSLTHVGVILSCREAFDDQIFSNHARRQWVEVNHPGFVDAEFDAQLEFFLHYDIPSPDVPLLTPEFSRPLFLRLMCETIKGFSQRHKREYLRSIASGQKGMTKVLEDFVKKLTTSIEDSFEIQRGLCWDLLKGQTVGDHLIGVAPLMAEVGRDSITKVQCLNVIAQITSWTDQGRCEELLECLIADGLLLERLRWDGSGHAEEIQLPYQRFSDHLIARHLLERYLDTTNEATIRRSFYVNRPLGRIFEIDRGRTFAQPGLAAAIMVEFAERVKRVNLPEDSRELVFNLPKKRRLTYPVKEIFLNGLYWRSANSFSSGTERVMSVYLDSTETEVQAEALEVFTALVIRPDHRWSPDRLTDYLARKTLPDRDLSWSEYLRTADLDAVVYRIIEWVERRDGVLDGNVAKRYLAVLPLLLTTTKRDLRDRATRCLFLIGGKHPSTLFDSALALFNFPDPYVPERVLAACYGVAMAYWADPQGAHVRRAIPRFARGLHKRMFNSGAQHSTAHVLMQDYALGVIELAMRVDPGTLKRVQVAQIRRPLKHVKSPFPEADSVTCHEFESVNNAFRMDFENYTLGRLVEDRRNYDDNHPDYRAIRRQIRWRVRDLGYSDERFSGVDGLIENASWHSRGDRARTERYGKKYSWIAFFEMYGVRSSQGLLQERDEFGRPSDSDIDPSFPLPSRAWIPHLDNPLSRGPEGIVDWVSAGPTPDYQAILKLEEIDGVKGPWLLLDGFIEQGQEDDARLVFTFLRCLLANPSDMRRAFTEYDVRTYPGNEAIPDHFIDARTFAGEIPWSARFANSHRGGIGTAKRLFVRAFGGCGSAARLPVRVELPIVNVEFAGSVDTAMNKVNSAIVPSPALCDRLGLVNHARQLDLYDSHGVIASICLRRDQGNIKSRQLYIREDLLVRYMMETGQTMGWFIWGERNPNRSVSANLQINIPFEVYGKYDHIHKQSYIWKGHEPKPRSDL